jgi:hypothetical protein
MYTKSIADFEANGNVATTKLFAMGSLGPVDGMFLSGIHKYIHVTHSLMSNLRIRAMLRGRGTEHTETIPSSAISSENIPDC